MLKTEDFSVEILVGGEPIKEYEDKKSGRYYVESNLYVEDISYECEKSIKEENGIHEKQQKYPVTPYQIKINANNKCRGQYFRVSVDGEKIKGLTILPGSNKIVSGFRDRDNVKELLFSLPDIYERDTKTILTSNNRNIGTIGIECWKGELRARVHDRRNSLNYKQATKADSTSVTGGKYTMITSKVGKIIEKKDSIRSVDKWRLLEKKSELMIYYRSAYDLECLGFKINYNKSADLTVKKRRFSKSGGKVDALFDLTGDGDSVCEIKIHQNIDCVDLEIDDNLICDKRRKSDSNEDSKINKENNQCKTIHEKKEILNPDNVKSSQDASQLVNMERNSNVESNIQIEKEHNTIELKGTNIDLNSDNFKTGQDTFQLENMGSNSNIENNIQIEAEQNKIELEGTSNNLHEKIDNENYNNGTLGLKTKETSVLNGVTKSSDNNLELENYSNISNESENNHNDVDGNKSQKDNSSSSSNENETDENENDESSFTNESVENEDPESE